MQRLLLLVVMVAAACLMAASSGTAYTLVWAPGPGGGAAAGYVVDISTDGGATWPYHYRVSAAELPLDDKCNYGQAYQFKVSAYNDAGISAPTEPLLWVRPAYAPPDDAPLPPIGAPPAGGPEGVRVE